MTTDKRLGGSQADIGTAQDYEAHFHASPAGYVITDALGMIQEINDTLAEWVGQERRKLIGTNLRNLLEAEDYELYLREALPGLETTGCFDEMVLRLLTAGGGALPVLMSGKRSEEPSEQDSGANAIDRLVVYSAPERTQYEQGLLAGLRKAEAVEAGRVTAEQRLLEQQHALEAQDRILQKNLKQSLQREALLETILNAADVGLLVVDRAGQRVMRNAHLATTWNRIAGGSEGTGSDAPILYGADRGAPLSPKEHPIRRAAAGESFSEQIFWVGSDQEQMAVSVSARPVKDSEGFIGSVLSFGDVTRLIHAMTAQEEFVANVSHELRTPLTSILGYLDLVLDENLHPAHVRASLNVVQRNAERLLTLVSDLLSVASGTKSVERVTVNLSDLVRMALASAAPRAESDKVELIADIPEVVSAAVDPRGIGQVLDNLLSNAVKYSPGGGTVTVRLRKDGQTIHLEVADTGMGISEADRDKVFTKFFRSRKAMMSAIPGAGLGLVITRNIIQAHGGTLTFTSKPGKGTVFTAVFTDTGGL